MATRNDNRVPVHNNWAALATSAAIVTLFEVE